MNRVSVSSSNIAQIGYSPESSTLEILFHTGSVYQYFNVPASVYSALMNAYSKGTYFAQSIKNSYRYIQVS